MSARRQIVVDGRVFDWQYGNRVVIRCDNGVRAATVFPHEILGITSDAHERGHWKQTPDGMVTPRDVANWIRDNLLSTSLRSTG